MSLNGLTGISEEPGGVEAHEMSLMKRYPRTARVLKELAFYAAVLGGVFVFYAYVLPLVGFET